MKKFLIFMAIVALSYNTHAQNAALKITNWNNVCSVFVDVYATSTLMNNGTVCDIRACFILPPGGGSVSFADPAAAFGSFCTVTNPFGLGGPTGLIAMLAGSLGTPDWVWTDATFQYSCPDCGEGGNLRESYPPLCTSGHCLTTGGLGWGSVVPSCPPVNASWTSPGNCTMSDVQIDFW